MTRLIAILTHPTLYFNIRRDQERMVLFSAACSMLNISEPDVWDVDRIHEKMNAALEWLHKDSHVFDGTPIVKGHLFWTLLISKFRQVSISRQDVKDTLDKYNLFFNHIPGPATILDVVCMYTVMTSKFNVFVNQM